MNEQLVEKARTVYREAEMTSDISKKANLYLDASKLYLSAAESVRDNSAVSSLVYLSSVCVFNATNPNAEKRQQVKETNEETEDISLDDLADNIRAERLILAAHDSKILGKNKLRQQSAIAYRQIEDDLVNLEKSLEDIGFYRDDQNGFNVTKKLSNLHNSNHITSSLGESFMVLNNRSDFKNNQNVEKYRKNETMLESTHNSANSINEKKKNINDLKNNNINNPHSSVEPSIYWSQVLKWAELVKLNLPTDSEYNISKQPENFEDLENTDRMLWSVYETDEDDKKDEKMEKTIMKEGSNTTEQDMLSEPILNLLSTVQRLGEENERLVRRAEELGQLEQRELQLQEEMIQFQQLYKGKISRIKKYITENQLINPSSNTEKNVQSSKVIKDKQTENENKDNIEKIKETVESNTRQLQLEKMVEALLGRVYKANTELQKKEAVLKKYVKVINQLQKEVQSYKDNQGQTTNSPKRNSYSSHGQPTDNMKRDLNVGFNSNSFTNSGLNVKKHSSLLQHRSKYPSTSTLEILHQKQVLHNSSR